MVDILSLAEKKICICGKCKATLSFSPDDVTSFVERKYIGQAQKKYFLMCPNCNHKIVSALSWFPPEFCE
jgi:DNA-directed RNA polymerase subunit RPC12/RpoP